MTAMIVNDLAQIPMSPFLLAALKRAAEYAEVQQHVEVTLEHVLLALAEDPEATVVLKSCNVVIAELQSDISRHLGNIAERQNPDAPGPVVTSRDLRRILEAAAAAAQQGRRRELNGAILLAAIIGDGRSTAANVLRAQGLTFEAVIHALTTSPPSGAVPDARRAPHDAKPEMGDDQPAPARQRAGEDAKPPVRVGAAEPEPRSWPETTLEPQWEKVEGSDAESTDTTVLSELGRQSPPSHWAPPTPPAAEQTKPSQPRLQRAPPPLPPDAGLHPPRSETLQKSAARPANSGRAGGPPTLPPAAPQAFPHGAGQGSYAGGPAIGGAHARGPGTPSAAGLGSSQPRTRPSPILQAPPWPGGAPATAGVTRQVRPRSTQVRADTGQLVENIPRGMRAGVPTLVEVRIARAEVKALSDGLQGGGAAYRHELLVTKAMSVKLRAPDGGFWIETASPETQWIENVLGVMTDDFASWRWTVTPKSRGRKRLQLVVSARTVGADGLAAETALPDQIINVRVAINYGRTVKRWAGWFAAAVIGGLLARFGETAFDSANRLLAALGAG